MFIGIIIDIGVLRKSMASYRQFQALQEIDLTQELDTLTKGQVNV